ncbi:ribonuclease toxin HepT-like protein [Roseiflexus castenholzii]|uniref:ribonuclease toxin HepT-like protein n=1 Tax=Roseiflexus castenholzii TaxID=120962 RepID=UPI0038CD8BD7
MGAAWGDRPAVLSGNSVEGLREFLAFRYVVKNLYGRELDAETDRTPEHLLPGGLRPEHR